MRPRLVAEHIELSLGAEAPPRPLRDAIEKVLVAEYGMMAIQAAERAEGMLEAVARVISSRAEAGAAAGTLPILTLIGTATDIVCGSCHVLPHDTPAVAVAKENRIHAESLLSAMKNLTFTQFEKFGAAVLRELGVKNPHITKHGNDQGIDFYGQFSIGQMESAPAPFFKLAHDVKFAFAGQAKHYPTRSVGPDVVRELVGAISLARTKTYSSETIDLFEDIAIRPFSPLLALLFTTGELTSGAVQLSEAAGIISRSGRQLALYLADRGVGIDRTGETKVFKTELFHAWLARVV